MYSDNEQQRRRRRRRFIVPIVLLLAVLVFLGVSGRRQDVLDEGAAAVRAAVQREALQCYIVEGVYPPSLAYLEENYGLQINHSSYYVTYNAFASNIPPTVIVTVR